MEGQGKGDLLTSYNGKTFSYDTIGNLLSDGTWTYTWEHGRELATMTSGLTTWTYTYDANGMRTQRTTGASTYTYVYNGSQLSKMTYGSNALYFTYDAAGAPASVTYNGVTYFYVTNLQGDVVAILNSSGLQVVGYTYDAWGRPLTTTGTMASTLGLHNPLRYRGYVYDRETGLYYLQSRYYNPTVGRFINADSAASTGQGLLGNNMFTYCLNNPVNGCDPCGTCFHRWDFWNDCETCKNKTLWDYAKESVDTLVHSSVMSFYGIIPASAFQMAHYSRNLINQSLTEEELVESGYEPLGEDQDKFHQNNQVNGRNRKYVFDEGWFSSEVVFYSDGTINNTPEDRGTLNVYYGDCWFGNYVIHGIYDVAPYMIWGNSYDDSTTIIDRIIMVLR